MPDIQPNASAADAAESDPGVAPFARPEPLPDLTGRVLADYQLLRRLGVGGMGQVYLARQLSLKREVAVKLLRGDLARNETALKRFQAEAEAVARLNHPNIVHIHQLAEADGLRYMVLEYVDGRNLRDHLARKGPPDLPVCLWIMRQVVLALRKAHEAGIVHRDIKPENILVTRKVAVKVTDFGLSRFFAAEAPPSLTQSGMTLGTPLYMSPEQVQGNPIDHRSDFYSFGVTCYHLLAGEPPFRGTTAYDVAIKHVQEQPRALADLRPDLPVELCGMVHRMMAKRPDDRYQTAREILRELSRLRDGSSLGVGTETGPALSLGMSGAGANGTLLPTPVPALVAAVAGPTRWDRWGFAVVACAAAAAAGVMVYGKVNPPAAAAPPAPPPAAVGLHDVRPAEKLVTTRERELLALVGSRESKPEDILAGHIELGLMYVKDRRLTDAAAQFRKLEAEQFPVGTPTRATTSMAGRLGQAVVLAYHDNPAAAQASLNAVAGVLEAPFAKGITKLDKGSQVVAAFLAKQPDFAQVLGEALNRNALTLKTPRLEPPAVEQLRSPPRKM